MGIDVMLNARLLKVGGVSGENILAHIDHEGQERILDASHFLAFGAKGGELMAVVQTAMRNDATFPSLRDTIFTHPTMAEAPTTLLADVEVAPEAE